MTPARVPSERPLRAMLRQPWDALRDYDSGKLRADLLAGLQVAVVAVPQSLAYAVVAGVPPEYGLYTLIVQSAIGSLTSSQPLLSVGPINTQSLLVAAIVTRVVDQFAVRGEPSDALYLELVIALTLIKGLLQLGLASLRLGALVRFVSQAVIVGFTAGAGVLIAAGQLPAFLGVEVARHAGDWPGLPGAGQRLLRGGAELQTEALAIGLASFAALVLARALAPRLPGVLLAIAVGASAVVALDLETGSLARVGALPGGLPSLRVPVLDLRLAEALLGGALALALTGLMEAYAIGKTIAARTGDRLSANQELMSQGLTNALSSFAGCMPGSGSFTRSALNFHAGARTLYAGVWNALFVAVMLLLFGSGMALVPHASLAAILFVIAYDLIDWRTLERMRRASPSDFRVALGTLAATLLLPLEYAVFVGIALHLGVYLRGASRLHLAEMEEAASGNQFEERPLHGASGRAPIVFLQLAGDLFFGTADELEERLRELTTGPSRVVVIRLKRTTSVDATALAVLDRFVLAMQARGHHVVLCGVQPELAARLRAYGLIATLGPDNFFEASTTVFASARRALRRAHSLLAEQPRADRGVPRPL